MSVHSLHKRLAYGKTDSEATLVAGCRVILLFVRKKDSADNVLRHALTGVRYHKSKLAGLVIRFAKYGKGYISFFGEFVCVRKKVHKNLLDAGCIALHDCRKTGVGIH